MDDIEEYLNELMKIYSKLKQSVIRIVGSDLSKSLLFYLIDKKSENIRYRFLMDAAVDVTMINREILERLLHERYVNLIDNKSKIILTVRGIWQAEQLHGVCNHDKLLSFIENKWFKFKETSMPLKDMEKLVLFVLLMLRSYSEDSPIYIRANNDSYSEKLKQITCDLGDFMYSKNLISEKKYEKELARTDTRLPAINHFFRHTDKIAKKVGGYFMASGSKYYLNLYNNNADDMVSKLAMLFSKVFEKSLSYSLMQEIMKKAADTAYVQSIDMFDQSKHIFAKTEYDDVIEQALRRVMRKA